ncbi:MAG: Leucyl aminopeptidase [Candidatus Methanofastidiosum methylothiophilum]|uniref:Leucyl aminopeptidase n=1 Tax=Candidatus Methanofastidiosum methylothiophilum TaxID=1705564 RepID=A0A150IYS7_9EURY|nr:MAG: Leucyl aminopeptidase [Candidatus Methanofastidiosum methylthiophilus]KYC47668.1 MAG: Leucyl aminopeptidase [Candidatus Methanofastidiosum methylthiophilus]KYC50129.1 MAG: Leucyl aminopeptidase [Candidatus Methanofastidiosum methylthiophilus]
MDLIFDIYDKYTNVKSKLKVKSLNSSLSKVELNAKNLEIISISVEKHETEYQYKKDDNIIVINFNKSIPPETEFIINTETICRPTKNILEGLYYDETPAGAPPQQITQCQQWGFQRIVPCFDDMMAKCTYTTTIIADERYTNIITNGDIVEERHSIGGGRDRIKYANTVTPMAPYLFFLGVGTYSTFKREVEYPDGHRFMLELLVPPNSIKEIAEKALDVLHNCVLWTYLFTGPNQYDNLETRHQMMSLIEEREKFKISRDIKKLELVRNKLLELNNIIIPGYKYTGTVYREIAMQNSDFGGMENVGNTTISTNRIMPFNDMTDNGFEYMTSVKVHEYYHNLNGSEVTGKDPFQIWLNEAVTVIIERWYHEFLFGKEYSRLKTVLTLLAPSSGTFASDQGSSVMPIVPDGFNDPNELITGVTYVKAPEFVKMIETFMGKEKFVKGLDLYHKKFSHGNATTEDWIAAMEEVSGMSFSKMAKQWLKQTGFPIVKIKSQYDKKAKKLTLNLKQMSPKEGMLWTFPLILAIVDEKGNDIVQTIKKIDSPETNVIFENIPESHFLSLNRDYSFYGKVDFEITTEELICQIKNDKDIIAKYVALYKLLDNEKMRLLHGIELTPNEDIIDLYFELISDEDLMEKVGGQFLTIFESVDDRKFAHQYTKMYNVKKELMEAIANKYKKELLAIYKKYNVPCSGNSYIETKSIEIKRRQVKNVALSLLATLDTKDIQEIIKSQLEKSDSATDKLTAFSLYLNSSATDKMEVLKSFEERSKKNLVSWESFLGIIASNSSDDTLKIIKRIERSNSFRIEQSNDQRSLYVQFAHNRKKSLETEEGRDFLKNIIIKLSKINEYTAVNAIKVFGNIDDMEEKHHLALVQVLLDILSNINQEKMPSVYNTARRLLIGAPIAIEKYKDKYGEINFIN